MVEKVEKKARRPSELKLTEWARTNFRLIGELHSIGCHDEAHRLKYDPVTRADLNQLLHTINSPGLAKLVVEMPEADQQNPSSNKNGKFPPRGEPSSKTPLATPVVA
jgi:hypothetical protein